jgi:TPP-dependent 2-oxoacid decarboxylase
MVGSLSAINAIAGAYAEDLPVLIVAGGPNTLDRERCRLIHHSLGETDFYCSSKCFDPVTAGTFCVRYFNEATSKFLFDMLLILSNIGSNLLLLVLQRVLMMQLSYV